jgi:acetoin utilization protein AcuB
VGTALRLLHEHNLPALPVVEGGRFLGLVYEKDLLRLAPSEATTLDVFELREALDRLTVGRVLSRVEPLSAAAPLQQAMLLLGRSGLEAVPVMDGERLLGLLAWPALMSALSENLAPA